MELWKDICFVENNIIYDYTNIYQVSNFGRIRRIERMAEREINGDMKLKEKILKQETIKNGYMRVTLTNKEKQRKKFLVHRIVAYMFIENTDKNKKYVNHIDEDKTNNNVLNLEWCTKDYNNNYGTRNERHGLSISGENHWSYKRKNK